MNIYIYKCFLPINVFQQINVKPVSKTMNSMINDDGSFSYKRIVGLLLHYLF